MSFSSGCFLFVFFLFYFTSKYPKGLVVVVEAHMVLYFMYSKVVGFIFLQNNHKHLSFFVYFYIFILNFIMGKVFFLCLTEFCWGKFAENKNVFEIVKGKKQNSIFVFHVKIYETKFSISISNLI